MAKLAKFLQGVAGAAGGGGLNVEEVFSTDLWYGTGSSTNTITNNIDISGEGGLVWVHSRSRTGEQHILTDTENGQGKALDSSSTSSLSTTTESVQNLNSDGYSFSGDLSPINRPGATYVGWTFRKAPRFFDCVTWTGDGVAGRTISHNLGSVPGTIIVKQTSSVSNWPVYHRSLGSSAYVELNSTGAQTSNVLRWNGTDPTSTDFTVNVTNVNKLNETYVAYLFAHNDGDGDFGPTGDQDIIKCGSYTGNSTIGHTIDLGFEAQWVLVRSTSNLRKWMLYDAMRGMPVDGNGAALYPNSTDDEEALQRIGASNVGFQLTSTDSMVNLSGETYIYIAIRRGPMAVPESATDVFAIDQENSSEPYYTSNFPVDMGFLKRKDNSSSWYIYDRLRQGKELVTNTTAAEGGASNAQFDYMDGFISGAFASDVYSWMWKRAPNFFDVVAYTAGSGADTISHNLGVVPEMIWVKNRDDAGMAARQKWVVYHASVSSGYLNLHDTVALQTSDAASKFGNGSSLVAPTADNFTVADDYDIGRSGYNYIAYLFASLDGVSKVGSYTGNGSTQNIDCGFSNGARFVLIKATSVAYGWMLFDTERGITSGNDSLLLLNDTDAETTAFDSVDPYSSGFTAVQGPYNVNQNGVSYIFYAIA